MVFWREKINTFTYVSSGQACFEYTVNDSYTMSRDEQGGIRTNTIVCLGKIAQYLHPKTRQQTLLSCFARSLKDPFPPSRIAALNAIAATQQYYTVQVMILSQNLELWIQFIILHLLNNIIHWAVKVYMSKKI